MTSTRPTAAAPTATTPTPAERARSAVEAAGSVDLVWDDGGCTVVDGITALQDGGLAWDVEDGTALHQRLARAAREDSDVGVCVAVTDLAPRAVRGRVRGHLALAGWLVTSPGTGARSTYRVRLSPEELVWHATGATPRRLDAEEYRAASPDPLAAWEADLLLGLGRDARLEQALVSLARRCPGVGAVARITPVGLDRTGIVLRADLGAGTRDVRLRFAHEATTAELAWAALEQLAAR